MDELWCFRPVMSDPQLCTFTELLNHTIDDVADMHELIDIGRLAADRVEAEQARKDRR